MMEDQSEMIYHMPFLEEAASQVSSILELGAEIELDTSGSSSLKCRFATAESADGGVCLWILDIIASCCFLSRDIARSM